MGLYNTPTVWQALEQWKGTLWLDSKLSYHWLGPFPNTPDKTLDWKSVKLSKSHLCSEPQKAQIVMPWSLPLSESYRSLIQTTQALSTVRSQDQEPQRPSVRGLQTTPFTYQGQVAGAGTGTEQNPRRHSIVTSPTCHHSRT